MWIGLLGPLVITNENQQVKVSAAKQRALFAALAVRPADVVPVDSLAEALWDGDRPASWHITIRNYVKRLRQVLGAELGDRIVTSPPGYRLAIGEEEIDLLAFESFRRAGMAAHRAGDWQLASAKLREADALWRGTPFADIPSRMVRDAHEPYLEEARLAAIETRTDAELRLWPSRAADLIPELQRLTSLHPGRERLRHQLILALYRCGRQADALTAFREARRFSIEELGIEPGLELHELHQRILTADRSLLARHWARPRQPSATGALLTRHRRW